MVKNFFKNKEMRSRFFLTLFIIFIYRLGGTIPVPFIDTNAFGTWFSSTGNEYLSLMNMFSGGMLENATIFSLSVTTYISAQIIIQLLTFAIPVMEKWRKEGIYGKKNIDTATKIATIVLSLVQSTGYYLILRNNVFAVRYTAGFYGILAAAAIILSFVGGSCIILWLANKITEKGLGNGVSLLLFAGIISRLPQSISAITELVLTAEVKNIVIAVVMAVSFLFMLLLIVFVDSAERKIPIRYASAKSKGGNYGSKAANTSFFPVKLNMAGVMPIIFASTILYLPQQIDLFVKSTKDSAYGKFLTLIYENQWVYCTLFLVLIIIFNIFYVLTQYDPMTIANNLRQSGGQIIGIRSGKPTSDYFLKVFKRMLIYGSVFLVFIALFPIVFRDLSGLSLAISGTSILILVNVALELKKNLQSQLVVRNHAGFL